MRPKTRAGFWSVWLNVFFLAVILVSLFLVFVVGVLDFDDTWWDVTATIFFAPVISFVLGLTALKKKDNSVLVYLSLAFGFLVILFILLHGLFISD